MSMTEAEWNACADPQPMLEFLQGKGSERKLRLFACACCRRIWNLLTDERSRNSVELAEGFADGKVSRGEMEQAASQSLAVLENTKHICIKGCEMGCDTQSCVSQRLPQTALVRNLRGRFLREPAVLSDADQTAILRCIFGPLPFRPIAFDSIWLTTTVEALAATIYEEKAFDRMPILGDALEEAGCTDTEILAHCRGPGPHVRGCWALDLVLGKE